MLDVDEGVDGAAITVGGFSGVEIVGERSAFLLAPLGHLHCMMSTSATAIAKRSTMVAIFKVCTSHIEQI